jgi:uncharacterized protein (DUF1330 family)
MITCYLRYIIDPYKLKEFEHYGKLWIPLVEKFGGKHHGYFMPSEGANNVALALFTFPSLHAMRNTEPNRSRTQRAKLRSNTPNRHVVS